MGFLGNLLAGISTFALHVLTVAGYPGLFALMAAESMVLPVPSEAVMPFAGYLVAQGRMSWPGAILAATLGSLAGSWLSYLLGRYGFLPLVERYGKYVLLGPHQVQAAHAYLERRGASAIFACRFIPGVRHVISIPAGSAQMPLRPFLLASVAGAAIWNTFLLWVGWRFGTAAASALKPYLDLVGIALLVLLAAYVAYEVRKGRKAAKAPPT